MPEARIMHLIGNVFRPVKMIGIEMSHTPHELHDVFPDDGDILHQLKLDNGHFQKLSDRYHGINREIHRIETGVEPSSDDRFEDLKKQRLAMLDEIGQMIKATTA